MLAGLGAGILSGVGGLISNIMTGDRQEDAQRFNAEQAQAIVIFKSVCLIRLISVLWLI